MKNEQETTPNPLIPQPIRPNPARPVAASQAARGVMPGQEKPSLPYRIGRDINTAVNNFADVQKNLDTGMMNAIGDVVSGLKGDEYRAATPVASATPAPVTPTAAKPDGNAVAPGGITREGDAYRMNTQGGFIQSSDQAAMARVLAGQRGLQPKDGQSFVSNNFMTVPAYQTPQSLIDARQRRMESQAMAAPAAVMPAMPEAPKMIKAGRMASFSDIGDAKRQNRWNSEQYAMQMRAYENAANNAGMTERQQLQNQNTLANQGLIQQGSTERQQSENAVNAPYRQAMADYYKGLTDMGQAGGDWRQRLRSGGLSTRSGAAGDGKYYSVELGDSQRAVVDPQTGTLNVFDPVSKSFTPLQMGGSAPLPPTSMADFTSQWRSKYKDNPAMLNDDLMQKAYSDIFGAQ